MQPFSFLDDHALVPLLPAPHLESEFHQETCRLCHFTLALIEGQKEIEAQFHRRSDVHQITAAPNSSGRNSHASLTLRSLLAQVIRELLDSWQYVRKAGFESEAQIIPIRFAVDGPDFPVLGTFASAVRQNRTLLAFPREGGAFAPAKLLLA